jgi:GNAT superfamily N-acetyltransferase
MRTGLQPGDLSAIVSMHGRLYAEEYGFDTTFEPYVAEPLSAFARRASRRECVWIEYDGERLAGCVAIVEAAEDVAQLRWFLVHPSARGRGLGRRLLSAAVVFSRDAGYARMVLWTVGGLAASRHLYAQAGFVCVESSPARLWGVDVVEEKHELALDRLVR